MPGVMTGDFRFSVQLARFNLQLPSSIPTKNFEMLRLRKALSVFEYNNAEPDGDKSPRLSRQIRASRWRMMRPVHSWLRLALNSLPDKHATKIK